MRRNEHKQVLMRELTKAGLKPHAETTGGNHLRITWHYPNGARDFFVTSNTPSDHRSTINARAVIRQKLRNAGVLDHPLPEARLAKALELPDPDHLTLLERVNLLERDVEALLDLLAMRAPAEATVQKVTQHKPSHQVPNKYWVLDFMPIWQPKSTKEIAETAKRNYYTTYSALTVVHRKGWVERERNMWVRIAQPPPEQSHERAGESAGQH